MDVTTTKRILLGIVLLIASVTASYADSEPGTGVLMIQEVGNEVMVLEWKEGLTISDVLVQRKVPSFRLVFEVWRRTSRVSYKGRFDPNLPVLAGDVVVLGTVSDERRKAIEAIPAVAALKLLPDSRQRRGIVPFREEPGVSVSGGGSGGAQGE